MRHFKRLFLCSFVLTASSCATVLIKDQVWCADEGHLGADCYHTLTQEHLTLTKAQWDDARFGQVCTSANNFADIKGQLEKLCHESRRCSYEQVKALEAFFGKILKKP